MALRRITLGADSSGRPLVLDERTLAKVRHAEAQLGASLTIVQGSYRGAAGASASAGTHDRGGVIDIRVWDLAGKGTAVSEVVLELRRAGLIAWYRTKAQGFDPHIHAIDHGNPELSPSAARQVAAWEAGRNGLASNGPDDGPRVTIPKAVPEEDDMPYTESELKQIVGEAVAAKVEPIKATLDRLADAERRRSANVRKRLTAISREVRDDATKAQLAALAEELAPEEPA